MEMYINIILGINFEFLHSGESKLSDIDPSSNLCFIVYSWKDIPDHTIHLWQFWQHLSGK